jgi:hypothetical protein
VSELNYRPTRPSDAELLPAAGCLPEAVLRDLPDALGPLVLRVSTQGVYKRANERPASWHQRHVADSGRLEQVRASVLEAVGRRRLEARPATRRLVVGVLYAEGWLDDDNAMAAVKYDVDAMAKVRPAGWSAGVLWRDSRRWCRMPWTPGQVLVRSAWRERTELWVYELGEAPPPPSRQRRRVGQP